MMNVEKNPRLNMFLWMTGILFLVAGIGANYYFSTIPLSLRLIGWIILLAFVLWTFAKTQQGTLFLAFAKDAKIELRKVTWPTRQETIQTTALVVLIVLVMGLFMWGVDSILLWAVGWLTGQRG